MSVVVFILLTNFDCVKFLYTKMGILFRCFTPEKKQISYYSPTSPSGTVTFLLQPLSSVSKVAIVEILRRNPIEDGAISGFSGQKSVPE